MYIAITGLRPGDKLHEELAAPDEETIQTGIEKVNLLDTSVGRLPEPIADAIEEERIDDGMAYLKAEIMAIDAMEVLAWGPTKTSVFFLGSRPYCRALILRSLNRLFGGHPRGSTRPR